MTSDLDGQLAFDIEGMIHEAAVEAAPEWKGAPLHFTTNYYSPADLDAAFEYWQFLGKLGNSHTQSRMGTAPSPSPAASSSATTFELFTADLRCEPWKRPEPRDDCCCVGDLTYQAICEPCGWHGIAADENSAVEGSHDHALPCWRELPIVPARLRGIDKIGLSKAARKWIEEQYPAAMRIAGAPVITERGKGTRHVPGRSPWGGYDLSHTAADPQRKVAPCKQRRTPDVSLKSPHVAAAPRGLALGDDERSEENT